MDTAIIVIVAILACIVVAAFVVFRLRSKVEIKGPLNIGLKLDASNEPEPTPVGVKVEHAKSRRGGILVDASTDHSVKIGDVEVDSDILVNLHNPKSDTDPKG